MTPAWIAAVSALWVLVLLLTFLVLGTLRRVAAVLEQVVPAEAPVLGAAPTTVVSPFEVYDELGALVTWEEVLVEPATILLFIEPGCLPCLRLLEQLDGVGERLEGVPFHMVTSDSPEARELPVPQELTVLYQRDGDVTRAFSNRATPQAYAVGNDRVVLDRRLPAEVSDLREMASYQRDGGGDVARLRAAGAGGNGLLLVDS